MVREAESSAMQAAGLEPFEQEPSDLAWHSAGQVRSGGHPSVGGAVPAGAGPGHGHGLLARADSDRSITLPVGGSQGQLLSDALPAVPEDASGEGTATGSASGSGDGEEEEEGGGSPERKVSEEGGAGETAAETGAGAASVASPDRSSAGGSSRARRPRRRARWPDRAVVMAFCINKDAGQTFPRLKLKGLNPNKRYQLQEICPGTLSRAPATGQIVHNPSEPVWQFGSLGSKGITLSGKALMSAGLPVRFEFDGDSVVYSLTEVGMCAAD